MPRLGFGNRDPSVRSGLKGLTRLSEELLVWGPDIRLRVSTYAGRYELPPYLVSSVRCIVLVDERVLVMEDADGMIGVLPGGRIEPGETWAETACREVHEETGVAVQPASLEPLGFVHLEHLNDAAQGHPYPNPDFLQLIFTGTAKGAPVGWVDADNGYVQRSWLHPVAACGDLPLTAGDRALLALALARTSVV